MPPRPAASDKRPYGSGTVARVDATTWRAQLPRAVDPARRSRRFPTEAEAEAWLAQQIERFARGLDPDADEITLGEYVDDWISRNEWDQDTARAYRNRRRHLAVIDHVALADLRPSHVERVVAEMRRKQGRGGTPLSERYCRLVVAVLSSVLQAAIRDGILARNVVASARLPKLPQTETVVLSETEARALLRASVGTRWHAVWWVLLSVALRSGEARALRLDDVHLASGRLRVRRSAKTPRRIGATKGRRERWVPLPPPCVAAIRAHLELLKADTGVPKRGRRKGSPSVEGSPWLFPSHVTGRPFPSNTLRANLLAHLKAAGVDPVRVHDLRHASITFMLARGRPLPLVAEIAGHRSSAFTAARYGHVLTGQYREVAETMADVLSEPKDSEEKRQNG